MLNQTANRLKKVKYIDEACWQKDVNRVNISIFKRTPLNPLQYIDERYPQFWQPDGNLRKRKPRERNSWGRKGKPAGLMYVLTNTINIRGAAAILYPGVLKEIAGQLGGDFIIFPSSIHETILAKAKGFFDWEAAEATVSEINLKEVEPEDILSDTVYYYHQAKDCIMVAWEMGDGTDSILW